jgi:MFS family permease
MSSPFRNRQFFWLLFSNTFFFFAMNAGMVLRAWIAFKLTDSELALGTMVFSVAVPMFFLSPFGGVMADRLDRRSLIMAGQTAVLVADLTLFLLLWTDRLQYWHLLVNGIVLGCSFPFIMPARNAIVVNIVGKAGLERGMAANMGAVNLTRVVGPAIAGVLIDLTGVKIAYIPCVVLYGLALLLLTQVSSTTPEPAEEDISAVKRIMEGVHYMRENRLVLILLLFGLMPIFLGMPVQNLMVVFAERVWHVGARGFGFLSACFGIGGVVGAIWVAMIKHTYHRTRWMMSSSLLFCVLLFCFAFSPWFLLGLALGFLSGVFMNIFNALNNTTIQLLIPDNVRGRITSFLMMSFSLPLLGTLPLSAAAEVVGAPLAVGIAAVVAAAITTLFYILSTNLRRMDRLVDEVWKSNS